MNNRIEQGILVNAEGFFVGVLRWPSGEAPPKINVRRKGEKEIPASRKQYLIRGSDLDGWAESFRWDFKPVREVNKKGQNVIVRNGTWRKPPKTVFIYMKKDGQFVRRMKIWPTNFILPNDLSMTEVMPEKDHKSVGYFFDEETQAWRKPNIVTIKSEDGSIVNRVVENPLQKTPWVEPEKGQVIERQKHGDNPDPRRKT